ncbi:hypothetical protein KIPB_004379 [Kipferlia bialata]|uniref:Brix domain-containing protein n=1 Tax=Kipferlia bialata TaxID=797122 RepID=A0A9K3GI58_9EUKA|nr:hypothetical protein KIPB_004379 [Kipferlia bialata]|eukprot:g4379.t1
MAYSSKRHTRLRKGYLLTKQLEERERALGVKKDKVKKALEGGAPLSHEVRGEAVALGALLEYDDTSATQAVAERTGLDDEYAKNGEEPKLLLTTSRSPSSRLSQFAKEMRHLFPNCQRVNRGKHVLGEIVDAARKAGVSDLLIVHETKGQPDALIVSHMPYGPTAHFTIRNAVLRHDIEGITDTYSGAPPHLVFEGMNSQLGQRLKVILQHLFPPPKERSKRIVSFINKGDILHFRHHMFDAVQGEVLLKEAGPRFELIPYKIVQDTVESRTGEVEWVLHPFTNAAKRKNYLST